MSADVFLNLLNELGEIRSLLRNNLNKFNNIGARMLDSIYHMAFKLLKNHIFGVKISRFCHLLRNFIYKVIKKLENIN